LHHLLSEYFGELDVLSEMRSLLENLVASGLQHHFAFDGSLARGLDYYTGLIFEAVL
jgi:histidyl-tRNA synthetase